jgi:hypothetical protein
VEDQRCYVGVWSQPLVSSVILNGVRLDPAVGVFPIPESAADVVAGAAEIGSPSARVGAGDLGWWAAKCFALPVARLAGYNSLRLVFATGRWERLAIQQVALGIG